MPLIRLDQVFVRRYDVPVLNNIEWEVNPGEHWAVIGGNGSGKTTLLEVVAGKWPARSGKITRNGTPELVASDYSFHRIVSAAALYYQQRFQSQDADLAPTVRDVLTDRLKPVGTVRSDSVTLMPATVSDEALNAVCGMLAITHLLDHPFVTLSNGETRRMLLARSLLKKPDILVLDYPFSGLDVHSREVLHQSLTRLSQSGTTIILAAPPHEIPEFITHVLELRDGRIIAAFPRSRWQEGKRNTGSGSEETISGEFLSRLGPPQEGNFEYAFRLRRTRVVYDGRAVLDNVDWTVRKGERWALSGPNGSGKSTLLSIITADHPQRFANDFEIFDKRHKGSGWSIWDIKKRIGHVSPEIHMYFPSGIDVYKTIASGFFDATGVYFKKISQEQEDRIRLVADMLKVSPLLGKTFKNLSKGQQRMVLLARALVKNPPLLILDEPCQGLDLVATEYFKSMVDAICEASDYTLIYVSHYPQEIPSCVKKRLALEDGRVVFNSDLQS